MAQRFFFPAVHHHEKSTAVLRVVAQAPRAGFGHDTGQKAHVALGWSDWLGQTALRDVTGGGRRQSCLARVKGFNGEKRTACADFPQLLVHRQFGEAAPRCCLPLRCRNHLSPCFTTWRGGSQLYHGCSVLHLHAFVFSISLGCCLIFRAVIFPCVKCLLEQGWEVPALFCSVTRQVKRKQCPCFSFQREVNKQMVNG